MRARDALAGALLLNSIPHTIVSLAGKRCMTPLGGAASSPKANLLWAGTNLAAGTLALGLRGWRAADQRTADERLRSVTLGMIGGAAFAAVYELTPSSTRHRELRAEAARNPCG